ncbi:unannotated protein [freshwater metagenome]|uniref:Unannotated protein n=2 Tax=freshwater metagenome TaxID=449393 RepID=A0A6J5Z708_9ZZZZ
MVRSGKEAMTRNRRTRRTIILTAIFVLLLAGVVGELAFGDRGGIKTAEAQDVSGAMPSTDIDWNELANGGGMIDVSANVTTERESDATSSTSTVSDQRGSTPDAESGNSTGRVSPQPGIVGSAPVPGVVVTMPEREVTAEEPGTAPVPSSDSGAPSEGCGHAHGVDDHAVEHSEHHAEREAVSHGHDEEAHEDHRSNS